jgi:hypothetical protein
MEGDGMCTDSSRLCTYVCTHDCSYVQMDDVRMAAVNLRQRMDSKINWYRSKFQTVRTLFSFFFANSPLLKFSLFFVFFENLRRNNVFFVARKF